MRSAGSPASSRTSGSSARAVSIRLPATRGSRRISSRTWKPGPSGSSALPVACSSLPSSRTIPPAEAGMLADPWFYAAAVPAVVIVGLAKGGFGGGISILGVPLMALVISPLDAAAIMLPIMIVMDVVALFAWRGVWDRPSVAILLPSVMVGIGLGWAVAAYVTDEAVRFIVGAVALAFTLDYLFRGRMKAEPKPHNPAKGWFWGTVSGFTSFVSHAGGPPMQMYLLPLRLDPRLIAGTTVLIFAVANFVKLLPYAMLGQFSTSHLAASAVLLPLGPVATWFGTRLVRIISVTTFYRLSYAALFIIALKLLWDGAANLI